MDRNISIYGQEVIKDIRNYKLQKYKVARLLEDINFFKKCKEKKVYPNFINRNIKMSIKNGKTLKALERFKSHWLRSEISERYCKLNQVNKKLYDLYRLISSKVKSFHPEIFDNYIGIINVNCDKIKKDKRLTLDKKLKQLCHNITTEEPGMDYVESNTLNIVTNLSKETFTNEQLNFLNMGLKHRVPLNKSPIEEVVVCLETEMRRLKLENDHKHILREEISQVIKSSKKFHLDKAQMKILKELKSKDVYYIKADKGKNIAIMDKNDYEERMKTEIENGPFCIVSDGRWKDGSPLHKLQNDVKKELKSLSDNCEFNKFTALSLTLSNPKIPSLYGLPKLHKIGNKMRLVVSNINSPTSKISEYIVKQFKKLNYHSKYSIKNSIELTNKLADFKLEPDDFLVSFDIIGLFPNIPIDSTLEIVKNFLETQDINTNQKEILFRLIDLCLQQSIFQFRDNYYKQVNGVPIGNNISPILAEIFMCHFENKIANCLWFPKFYTRYVDDILVIIKQKDLEFVLEKLNKQNKTIKFTYETEDNQQKLPFLDLLIKRENNAIKFSIYRKETDNDRFIDNKSMHCIQHKNASLNFLIHRLLSIPLQELDFNDEWRKIINIAIKNGYSEKMCENILHKKKIKIDDRNFSSLLKIENQNDGDYICLPFYPQITNKIQKVLRKKNLKIVYKNPGKLSDLLGNPKDKVKDFKLKSGIYKMECLECGIPYIGQTKRNLKIRQSEHESRESSVVFQHCNENSHQMKEIELLKQVDDPRLLDAYESFYLKKFSNVELLNEQPMGNLPSKLYGLG